MAEARAKLAQRLYDVPSAAFDEARACARCALLLQADSERAHVALAAVALNADYDTDSTHELLNVAARRRPDLPSLNAIRVQAYLLDRRLERAQLAVQEALDWYPDSVMLRTLAGLVDFYAGSYAKAIRRLQHLVNIEPGAAFGQYLLAAAHLFAGDILPAREQLKAIVARDLRPPDECDVNTAQHALAALIFLEARYGDHDAAVRLYHEFASYFTGQYISPVCLAVCLAGFGHGIETAQKLRAARASSDPRLIFVPLEPFFNHMRDCGFEKICDEVLKRKTILEDRHFKT
jgi:tetratricopeptide (TPR) repeat protein